MKRHWPALDGLRGVALLGVLLFHANGALAGGYLGVDLFFVLSGFLITSLLVEEHMRSGRIDLQAFWVRRARRLFPALLSLMPAVALYARVWAKPAELRGIRGDALATLGYVANWRAIFSHKSYWEMFAAPSPLEHTWSLSIEEQFYVVWPLVALVVLRWGKRALLGVSVALGLGSMVAMTLLSNAETSTRAYMGTDTRATAILAGAVLALSTATATWERLGKGLDVAGGVAAVVLAAAWWKLDGASPWLYRGGFWVTEACAVVLIGCALAGQGSLWGRALAVRPLRWLGTISYGAYLWHWPVDVVLDASRTHLHGFVLHGVQIAVALGIATASYRLLERPIRLRGVPFGRPLVVVPAAVAVILLIVVHATKERLALAAGPPPPPALPPPPPAPDGGPPFRILVLGDSTANSLGWALRGLREPGVEVELRGKDSCTMLWDTCGGESWKTWSAEAKPDVTLVFLGGAFLHGMDADGRWRQACYRKWNAQFEQTMRKRLEGLTNAWVVTSPYPVGPYDSQPWRDLIDCINGSLRKVAAEAKLPVLDFGERLCGKGHCDRELGGKTIRPDGVHYDIDGAHDAAGWVLREVK